MPANASILALIALASLQVAAAASEPVLLVQPEEVVLHGPLARQQLLVTGKQDGRDVDLTRSAVYRSLQPEIAAVDSSGLVSPVADGTATIAVGAEGREVLVPVKVSAAREALPVDFERDVQPLFTRFACNAGACHGKARGQNGFQLSLLGFDPEFDYAALTKEARGRRLFPTVPERSLLLQKPTGELPHGGGKRLEKGSDEYAMLLRWVASGTPRRQPETPALVRVAVDPPERSMANDASQQLLVTAHYADGSKRDVTRLAGYQSNESAIAAVDEHGLVTTGGITGDAAIMARYMGQIAVCSVAVPLPGDVPPELYAQLPRHNFIDEHVWQKLERLGLTPSEPAADHTLLRRAYVDVIGRVPTPEEARGYLSDTSADRYEKLIDHLLAQPEYAEHWANKWADLLRPNPYRVGIKATLNYDAWIREAFRKNKPYDEFVRELVTAQGSTFQNGAVTLFRDRREPDELTTIVSQLFLGVRLECAKCHHHPFEAWGQEHFYSFAAYFARIGRKGTGLSPPISGSEEIVFTASKGSVSHPLTGEVLEPKPLFGDAPEIPDETDPRTALAAWMTSGENPYFERVMANRVWADLMGLGLVEPVDDLRATNPASNGPLLEALGKDFREQGFDLKQLIRRIATSYVYRLSSLPNDRNVVDTRNYSRHYRQRLRAEVLLDSVCTITGIEESFDAMPPGSQAKEIWTHRVSSLFLDAFGRPDLNQDPPCERTAETSVVQALHLMNSENVFRKVTSDKGRAVQLASGDLPPEKIIEELYLLCYSRFPGDDERAACLEFFQKGESDRRLATEDILWALLNTPEFVFKD